MQKKDSFRKSRLDLIKKRHKELILGPREDVIDGFLEDDETFESYDEHEDMSRYDDYVKIGM
jgi:hypothetical protein